MPLAPESELLAVEEIKNPQDTPVDQQKRAEDIVLAHFEKTEKVLSDLKAAQNEGLRELDTVKSKLEEGNMPALRVDYLKSQE